MRFKLQYRFSSYYFSVLTLAKLSFQINDITYTRHGCSLGFAHKMMAFKIGKADLTRQDWNRFKGKEGFQL